MPNPKKIGGYSILSEIGSGGSGAVYRARDSLNDRDVALKILPHTDDLARFLQEARLAREIDHPNVIDVFDCGEDGGVRFIAMELTPTSLREILAKGRLSLSRSLDIFRQAALGLRAVHERGGVHGVVKPGGILLDSEGAVKVAGFGSARADDLTMTAYKPPELWRGERADARSDVYSLGAILHEALTGEAPSAAPGRATAKRIRPSVPTGLARIVEKALEFDPTRRWRTMDELIDAVSVELVNRCALIDFYEAAGGDKWRIKDNWLTDAPLGDWFGVTVNRDGAVTGLDNTVNDLEGELPSEITHLTELEDLVLDGSLSGSLPPELGGLANLKELNLGFNRLSGNIPPELGGLAKLEFLNLNHNRLSGDIPPELGGLAKLETLDLSGNRLSGDMPPELGGLANLERLDLADNRLSGDVPPELGGLAKLDHLNLADNRLSGSVPPELGGLPKLERLDLADNRLSGSVPPELGGLAKLDHLDLGGNELSGELPDELGRLRKLETLRLPANRLTGDMPHYLCGLNRLEELKLAGNDWTGWVAGALLEVFDNDLDKIDLPVCDRESAPRPISLRDVLAFESGGRLSLSRSVDICRQVALGIKAARERNIIHQDVKPENILIHADGAVETAGFGTARADARADIRALGAALYESLTGRTPNGEGLSALRPEAPTALRRIVDRCLSDRPDARYQSADELVREIADPALINRCALIDFYEAAGGREWKRSDNWLTDKPLDDWLGVTADRDGVVTGIELRGKVISWDPNEWNELEGEIPREIAYLSDLETLDLSENSLFGRVPPELGGLAKLKRLDLSFNGLSWGIPPELGALTELKRFDLGYNRLFGNIPPEFGGLAKLERLDLGDNRLSGNIPPELGGLAELKRLDLGYNRLSGNIPPELGGLAELKRLELGGNDLSGNIPPELGGLAELKRLDLRVNSLSGNIPPELGRLAELKRLDLSKNSLSGNIPPEFGGLAKLKRLDLSKNSLSGSAPPELGGLANLKSLELGGNRLSGNIPPELGGLAKLTWLRLGGNQFSGNIPPELGGLTGLERLDLHGNSLSWNIPPELGGLTGLKHLDLSENSLSGSAPPELGGLTGLEHLDLSENSLSGSIPPELGGLTGLIVLNLAGNDWTGCIPGALDVISIISDLYEINLPVCVD